MSNLKYVLKDEYTTKDEDEIFRTLLTNKFGNYTDFYTKIIGIEIEANKSLKELWHWFPILSIKESFSTNVVFYYSEEEILYMENAKDNKPPK